MLSLHRRGYFSTGMGFCWGFCNLLFSFSSFIPSSLSVSTLSFSSLFLSLPPSLHIFISSSIFLLFFLSRPLWFSDPFLFFACIFFLLVFFLPFTSESKQPCFCIMSFRISTLSLLILNDNFTVQKLGIDNNFSMGKILFFCDYFLFKLVTKFSI